MSPPPPPASTSSDVLEPQPQRLRLDRDRPSDSAPQPLSSVASKPKVQDSLSRVSKFAIIDSTLREGEQFAGAAFSTEIKITIARELDTFGVEYIELTSPVASEQSRRDLEAICKLGLKAKILTHIRCHMDDARVAVETGVDGVNLVIGTSSFLQEYSHGKNMDQIMQQATE
ncbi:homocitrate synthase lys21, partial [Cladochytrium tenue]